MSNLARSSDAVLWGVSRLTRASRRFNSVRRGRPATYIRSNLRLCPESLLTGSLGSGSVKSSAVPATSEGAMRPTVLMTRALFVLKLAAPLLAAPGFAATFDEASLRGITSIQVFVEGVDPADKKRGLTDRLLQTDVESQLRRASITVSKDAAAYLEINVNTLRSGQEVTSFSVVVMVGQPAYLIRDTTITAPDARTWWKGADGITATNDLSSVREAVADLVDQFITAYRKQNPPR